ncbi:MAG: glycosyltransferase family 4 protein, partial [Thermoplasmata archaeon]|nr:glycosyltransferase family 4 protein [Thermoplasmata archaeon]
IPPGIDLEAWSHPEGEHAAVALPDRFLLYAGRIAPNKGLPVLLRAFAMLPKSGRPALVLMGRDWGERPALEQLAHDLGISSEIVWLGHVDSLAEYRAVFRRASMFVLPSEWEAFGLVLLEAMAARVPIVASAVGGVPEVLEGGRSGRLIPYGAVDPLASAIGTLLGDDGERSRLVQAGAERVAGLTWARAVERHRALYRELARP